VSRRSYTHFLSSLFVDFTSAFTHQVASFPSFFFTFLVLIVESACSSAAHTSTQIIIIMIPFVLATRQRSGRSCGFGAERWGTSATHHNYFGEARTRILIPVIALRNAFGAFVKSEGGAFSARVFFFSSA
jgi:hypothetical protein